MAASAAEAVRMGQPHLAQYFYRSQVLYQPGDLVQPGNWGRVILGIGPAHNRFYPEYTLEAIRRLEFADKPSRMASAFVFENLAEAESWPRGAHKDKGITEYVYEVTFDASASIHRGDMNWIDAMPKLRSFEALESYVRTYWRGDGKGQPHWEVVVAAALKIENRRTTLEEDGGHQGTGATGTSC